MRSGAPFTARDDERLLSEGVQIGVMGKSLAGKHRIGLEDFSHVTRRRV
jgi:hypothetical protein